jgi:hypothetical protein
MMTTIEVVEAAKARRPPMSGGLLMKSSISPSTSLPAVTLSGFLGLGTARTKVAVVPWWVQLFPHAHWN